MVSGSLQVVARGLASEIAGYFVHVASGPLVTTSDPFLLPVWSPPLQWSGAHVSAGRQITGSLYASAKTHAGSCLSRAATLAPGTNGSKKVTTHVTMPTMMPAHLLSVLSMSQVGNILPVEEARQAHWFKLVVMAQTARSKDCLNVELQGM